MPTAKPFFRLPVLIVSASLVVTAVWAQSPQPAPSPSPATTASPTPAPDTQPAAQPEGGEESSPVADSAAQSTAETPESEIAGTETPAEPAADSPAADQEGDTAEPTQEATEEPALLEVVVESETQETPDSSESTDVPPADGEPADLPMEDLVEDVDLIPLPEDIAGDASMLDLTTDDSIFADGDIPPMEIPTALPSVPIGEPARVLSARYKELQIKTKKDPALVALWDKAQEVPTFEERRAALREYYRELAQKMREADQTLTSRINAMERAYLQRLEQSRIEPTIPLTPPPTPEPLDAPAPSPTPGA
jgi:hypothetical protein